MKDELKKMIAGRVPFLAHTWPGFYPLVYYTKDGDCLCATCAGTSSDQLADYDVYWEGPDMSCIGCNATIASAYGDPSTDDDDHPVPMGY